MLSRTEVRMLLRPGEKHARVDCPSCNGKKTLSISDEGGNLKWYCFRNSCSEKGLVEGQRSAQELRLRTREAISSTSWEVPEHFVSPYQTKSCVDFIHRWGLSDNLALHQFEARYDPKLNRFVFLTQDGLGATGRTLYPSGNALSQPKWLKYGTANAIFHIQKNTDTCIVTEDVISCVKCSDVASSLALQGTRLQPHHVLALRDYSRVVFALDPDAKATSLNMTKLMIGHSSATVTYLKDDPKCLTSEEIRTAILRI